MAKPWERKWDAPAPKGYEQEGPLSGIEQKLSLPGIGNPGGAFPDFIRGGLNKVRETTSQPILRFLAEKGFAPAQREMKSIEGFNEGRTPSTAEKVGGVAADMAMLAAPTPFGKMGLPARVIGGAAQGTAQHQAQNYTKTGEINPGMAAAEMAVATALPFAGAGIQKAAAKGAPKILEAITPKKMKGGDNPVDWMYALRNKLVPYSGGAKEISARTAPKIAQRDALRDRLLDESGSKVNVSEAIDKTVRGLRRNIGSRGGDRITAGQAEKAAAYADDALLTAGRQIVPGTKAVGLRKLADDRAKAGAFENAPAEVASEGVFNRKYRDVLEDELLNSMRPKGVEALGREVSRAAKRGGKLRGPQEIDLALAGNEAQKSRFGRYIANKHTLGKLTPIDIAAQDMAKSPHKLGNYIDLGLAGGGLTTSLYGDDNMTPAMVALGTIAARRGISSPGGARLLYDVGRGKGRGTAKTMMNLARTGFSPGAEEE